MADLAYILLTIAFFAGMHALTRGLVRLGARGAPGDSRGR